MHQEMGSSLETDFTLLELVLGSMIIRSRAPAASAARPAGWQTPESCWQSQQDHYNVAKANRGRDRLAATGSHFPLDVAEEENEPAKLTCQNTQ